MIAKPIIVKALNNCALWISYSDGTEGIVDVSAICEKGIFKSIKDIETFNKVYIDSETNAIAWSADLELCSDALYLKIKGLNFDQWVKTQQLHATNYSLFWYYYFHVL